MTSYNNLSRSSFEMEVFKSVIIYSLPSFVLNYQMKGTINIDYLSGLIL